MNTIPDGARAPSMPAKSRIASSLLLAVGLPKLAHAASVVAVRLWPAKDYTRITIESDGVLEYTQKSYENPPRLGVDITGIALTPALRTVLTQILRGG